MFVAAGRGRDADPPISAIWFARTSPCDGAPGNVVPEVTRSNGSDPDEVILHHPAGTVTVRTVAPGRFRLSAKLNNPNQFVSRNHLETSYPIDLIQEIVKAGGLGPAWVCDAIAREESPDYVPQALKASILGFLDESRFVDKRILDFGCGSGASTTWLARMFPQTRIVGIDLSADFLSIARMRCAHYGLDNIEFLQSPDGESMPPDLGTFDFVTLTGVYEHLLPVERKHLLPTLWSVLKPGGTLFLHKTPHRYFPVETHTSGLPLLNYLPDRLALPYARHFSRRKLANEDWPKLLRGGIRGATAKEIIALIGDSPECELVSLKPCIDGVDDTIDLWYSGAEKGQDTVIKEWVYRLCKGLKRVTGIELPPYLTLALQKRPRVTAQP